MIFSNHIVSTEMHCNSNMLKQSTHNLMQKLLSKKTAKKIVEKTGRINWDRGKKCRTSYMVKQSILWGGGWDCEGEGSQQKWGRGYWALLSALCLHFTSIIPECHLLIFHLPWQCYSWQLASFLPVSPFQAPVTMDSQAKMLPMS